MTTRSKVIFALLPATLAIAACSGGANKAPEPDGNNEMELAEDTDEGTVTDQMNSGAPDIREGGGRVDGGPDNPNEPVVDEDAKAEVDPAEVR